MEASEEDLVQQRVIPYVKSHELLVVLNVIKQIVGSVIREKFWHEKPSRGLITDDTRAKRRGEYIVQSPTDGTQGGSFAEFPPTCRSVWCGGLFLVMGAAEGLRYVSLVVAVCGLSLLGACGPNLVRIASNN